MSDKDENTVYLKCNVNEVFVSTEVCQYFSNPLSNPIELSISFPIKQEIQLNKFVVRIGNKVIVSKVLPKEKAKEKYNDSVSSGNLGFLGDYNNDGLNYNVLIGNILPQEKIILETSFLQLLTSNDMSYEFSIMNHYPSFKYKEMNSIIPNNKTIKGIINIKTLSKITRLISFFLNEENKKNIKINYSNDYLGATIEFEKEANLPSNNNWNDIQTSFSILFRTEKMNTPLIYSQFNPEKNETSYVCNFIYSSDKLAKIPIPEKPDEDNKISYYNLYQINEINDNPALFIFLIDQSGSMNGKSINIVKQALLLFIQSLPPKSFFQLIGFGSDFKYYNNTPVEYNKENVAKIIQVINDLKADMGGTNISTPLKDIFSSKNYDNINLAKNIFLLTDGQVHDREECINSISANNSRFRIQSIGIGDNFDKVLIERCGKLGKGTSSFVVNVEELNHIVIDTLNKCLRPYLTKINFDIKEISKIHIMPYLDNISYQDDIINYAFISKDRKEGPIDIILQANDSKNDINKDFKVEKIVNLEPGEELSKIIISNLLKISKDINEEEEIKLSKEYQVLSKNTSLFGEIVKDEINKEGELIKVELNQHENQIFNMNYYMQMNHLMMGSANPRNIHMMGMNPMMMNNNMNMMNINNSNNYNFPPQINYNQNYNQFPNMNLNINSSPNITNSLSMNQPQRNININSIQEKKIEEEIMRIKLENEFRSIGISGPRMNINMDKLKEEERRKHEEIIRKREETHNEKMKCLKSNFYEEKEKIKNHHLENMKRIIVDENIIKKENIGKDDLNKLLMVQDIIEGFWDENEITLQIIEKINDKFNIIESYVNNEEGIKDKKKAIFTTIVLYYFLNYMKDKFDELRLIINKGKKYLNSIGYPYDSIIQKTGI